MGLLDLVGDVSDELDASRGSVSQSNVFIEPLIPALCVCFP